MDADLNALTLKGTIELLQKRFGEMREELQQRTKRMVAEMVNAKLNNDEKKKKAGNYQKKDTQDKGSVGQAEVKRTVITVAKKGDPSRVSISHEGDNGEKDMNWAIS